MATGWWPWLSPWLPRWPLQDEDGNSLSDEDIAAEADTFMFEGEDQPPAATAGRGHSCPLLSPCPHRPRHDGQRAGLAALQPGPSPPLPRAMSPGGPGAPPGQGHRGHRVVRGPRCHRPRSRLGDAGDNVPCPQGGLVPLALHHHVHQGESAPAPARHRRVTSLCPGHHTARRARCPQGYGCWPRYHRH